MLLTDRQNSNHFSRYRSLHPRRSKQHRYFGDELSLVSRYHLFFSYAFVFLSFRLHDSPTEYDEGR